MRWMGCHLTGPAGRLPAPQRCKLVNMEANYCCPCDQGIIQPYHNTHAHTHAICADQQRPPSDPVVSPCTLLLNLLNRGQPRPASGAYRNWASVRLRAVERVKNTFCTHSAVKLSDQTLLPRTRQHLAPPKPPAKPIWPPAKGLKPTWRSPGSPPLSFHPPYTVLP